MDYEIALKKIYDIATTNKPDIVLKIIIEFLYENFKKYSWIGIYIIKENNLILGPWKGSQATEHTKIPIGKGICGDFSKV